MNVENIFSHSDLFLGLGGIFHDTFKRLTIEPDVLYPSLNTKQFDVEIQPENYGDTFTFLSINRYERKKNIKVAIQALGKTCRSTIPHKKLLYILLVIFVSTFQQSYKLSWDPLPKSN